MSFVSITKDAFPETPSVDETSYFKHCYRLRSCASVNDYSEGVLYGTKFVSLKPFIAVVSGLFLAPLIHFAIGLLIHL